MPVLYQDAKVVFSRLDILRKHVTFDKIVIISPPSLQYVAIGKSLQFVNENDLVSFQAVKQVFFDRGYDPKGHAGWYYQQFLKMSYARICKKEYYLIWDSDVVPIRKVNMFQGNHPYFDMASEHHHPYFVTLNRILPQLKFSNASYVSEHMIIKTEYMKNLLDEIERNDKIKGKTYWEKILYSIDIEELLKTGFSEFETYGTYVDNRYPNYYIHREWSSCRSIKHYYGKLANIRDQDIQWLAKDFDVITFEKWGKRFERDIYEVVINSYFQQLFSPKQLFSATMIDINHGLNYNIDLYDFVEWIKEFPLLRTSSQSSANLPTPINVDNLVQAIQSINNLQITKFLFILIILFETVFILIRFLCPIHVKIEKNQQIKGISIHIWKD